ncbi:four helix bundle protein [Candidatus Uhrbacteria bacterium]|nr:four helix bundle protein [Candidatus Uhrbacteria bacterium]
MEKIRSFHELRTWNEAQSLVEEVYNITSSFPKEEIYGLTSQIRRAAVSVP